MKAYRGGLLLETILALFLLGVLVGLGGGGKPKAISQNPREAPVILYGTLLSEMREVSEGRSLKTVRVYEHLLLRQDRKGVLEGRTVLDPGMRIYYGSAYHPTFTASTDYSFLINGVSNRSGLLYFYRDGRLEATMMIHLGTQTLDVRGP
ncbi:hypothetical protein KCG48_01285 [Proteiniclasticum sp. BAD-10]|uniref:Uncharacterized protein n=1 Tax=Proteiniclasticum sediminis TaxID=2804028 RepID=A0A941HP54_9CLOT|nr:hypothetical protein [Proteiniclasticum sediminis]MBR0574964.1 hypothetical protein [Proteiniclasticum sediminis]